MASRLVAKQAVSGRLRTVKGRPSPLGPIVPDEVEERLSECRVPALAFSESLHDFVADSILSNVGKARSRRAARPGSHTQLFGHTPHLSFRGAHQNKKVSWTYTTTTTATIIPNQDST